MSKLITILWTMVIVLSYMWGQPVMASAPVQEKQEVKILSVQETIHYFATLYGAHEEELLMVANCESKFTPTARGDHGLAYGVMQFHEATFNRYTDMFGESLDYYSYNDQIRLASWMFAQHPESKTAWTCWTKNKNRFT